VAGYKNIQGAENEAAMRAFGGISPSAAGCTPGLTSPYGRSTGQGARPLVVGSQERVTVEGIPLAEPHPP
jgi:hypothetical protein